MIVFRALAAYLKDWRNWLTHSLIGIGILLVAFCMPVKPIYRISLIALVVAFNVVRMRISKKNKAKKAAQKAETAITVGEI